MGQNFLRSSNSFNSSVQIFNSQIHLHPTFKSPPFTHQFTCKISRRELTIHGPPTSLVLLLGACETAIDPFRFSKARGEEGISEGGNQEISSSAIEESPPLDVSDGVKEENLNAVSEEGSANNVSNGGKEENLNVIGEEANPTGANNGRKEENLNANFEEARLEEGNIDASNGGKMENSKATDIGNGMKEENSKADDCIERIPKGRAFMEVSVDGQPAGRIVIGLYRDNAPIGTTRFSSLVSGAAGINYRRKEFVKIVPNYIQHGGVRSYGVDAELAKRTGSDLAVDSLISEWEKVNEKCPGTKNVAGTVGIIVRDPSKPPPKLKLVARKGRLEIDQEEVGSAPNGTEFVITTKDSPELDSSTLVIGRVMDGLDVVEKISQVKTVQENTSSPYFRVAKLIGDKRAVVAERGFNRPYLKIIITNCGLVD